MRIAFLEHKPLGVTNRIRKIVYDQIGRTRHEMNLVIRQEPQYLIKRSRHSKCW
jgi:hypothetical protein